MRDKAILKTLDVYIIKKFLGTFFFAILLIIAIAVIFDFSEKIDNFLETSAPFKKVIFEYYLNFIPYFAVLFSPLFTFIAVIYFTSRMAYNTEIIAILSSGVSFNRILIPYLISATVITAFSFVVGNYILPHANRTRLEFEDTYYHSNPRSYREHNIHKQIEPGVFIYMERYNTSNNYGRKFSVEKYEDDKLVSKLLSEFIKWDENKNKWIITNYYIRNYKDKNQEITRGVTIDTTLNMHPEDFSRRKEFVQAMTMGELNAFIENQRMQGSSLVTTLLIEKYRRYSFPFSAFILTMIGVSVSSRKVRGGIGMQLGIGLLISFAYILFMQFSAQFAISGALSPMLGVWLPNFMFIIIAIYLYKWAPK